MYEVKVISDFSAAHCLRGYKGKCENMHGHNWKIEVFISSQKLDKVGMVVDFKELKKDVNTALETLDHKNLNDLPYFKKVNPTSENIAKYIYDKLSHQPSAIPARHLVTRMAGGSRQLKITVWESDTACATYEP